MCDVNIRHHECVTMLTAAPVYACPPVPGGKRARPDAAATHSGGATLLEWATLPAGYACCLPRQPQQVITSG
jgi:hypothetical protein